MEQKTYTIHVQCHEETTGTTGTYIGEQGLKVAISPVFDSLAELYPWMRENGWVNDMFINEGTGLRFDPWRVVCHRTKQGVE